MTLSQLKTLLDRVSGHIDAVVKAHPALAAKRVIKVRVRSTKLVITMPYSLWHSAFSSRDDICNDGRCIYVDLNDVVYESFTPPVANISGASLVTPVDEGPE